MKKGIIGAGNWIIDKVKMIDRWPKEGELCNITSQQVSGGGGPCNVLFDIAALGADIPLYACGVVGDDAEGNLLLNMMTEKEIDPSAIYKSNSEPTSFTDVMTVSDTGRRTFFHDRGANKELDYTHIEQLDVSAKIFYLGYLLLLDGLDAKDLEYGTVAAKALALMVEKGYKTIVDTVSEDSCKFNKIVPPALKYIDCLVINELEAGNCSRLAVRDEKGKIVLDGVIKSAEYLLDAGVRETVVIHFPEGAVAVEKSGGSYTLESCELDRKDIVGSVGAGDAFCAGIVYGIHEDLHITDSLRIANVNAWYNLQCSSSTDGAPTLTRINEYLATHEFKSLEK